MVFVQFVILICFRANQLRTLDDDPSLPVVMMIWQKNRSGKNKSHFRFFLSLAKLVELIFKSDRLPAWSISHQPTDRNNNGAFLGWMIKVRLASGAYLLRNHGILCWCGHLSRNIQVRNLIFSFFSFFSFLLMDVVGVVVGDVFRFFRKKNENYKFPHSWVESIFDRPLRFAQAF